MILDQGIGAHAAQVEYLGVGAVWTWVSGEGFSGSTLTGRWENVIRIQSTNRRLDIQSTNRRIELK